MTAPNFPPLVSDFQAHFFREFTYGDGLDTVTEKDVQRALDETGPDFNPCLWDTNTAVGSTSEGGLAYMYLAAHKMVMNIQQMAGGLSAIRRGRGIRNSAQGVAVASGVGQAHVTYQVPPARVRDSASLLDLFQTTFGQRYMAMIDTRLTGNIMVVSGTYDNWSFLGARAPGIDPGPVA